ncbi:PREDICTED: uncharacterized protein C8orf46 homolog [Eurypyga helias]|uniref:uncharacterized protein C8orf46 homolog n=1 Tax=Eurypyga helias TaxID=54383 RepID=UPI0005289590|nr:PREDICTED: uncharacterized protein C8orf46 homolog [Eurypyga helias]
MDLSSKSQTAREPESESDSSSIRESPMSERVVAISDRQPHRTEKLQPPQGDLLQVLHGEDEVRGGLGRLQGGQWGPYPTKGAAPHRNFTNWGETKAFLKWNEHQIIRILQDAVLTSHRQRWRRTAEYDLTLPPAAEASLPLTGGNLCGTPSLLRKMWMKHKKKSEYLGATNSAFEAD